MHIWPGWKVPSLPKLVTLSFHVCILPALLEYTDKYKYRALLEYMYELELESLKVKFSEKGRKAKKMREKAEKADLVIQLAFWKNAKMP